jgi:beta-lactamase class A
MKQLLVPVLFLLLSANCCIAQKTDTKLEKKLSVLMEDFHGKMGVYVYDLRSGKVTGINEDTIYPTASMVKMQILVGIMHKIYDGSLQFHQRMTYTDSLFYSEGDDILASFKPGSTIELRRLISLMLSYSDNCASLWLQGLSGGGKVINDYMDQLGLKYTRVNSRTEGREENRKIYGWGQTTPKELASLMKMILDNKIINRQYSEKMLRMLGRQFWDEVGISQIPPGIFVADKNGAVDESRGEIMYVNAPHPYILAVCSKENEDKSWNDNNEAWVLTRKISAAVFHHYNRKIKYQPEAPIK